MSVAAGAWLPSVAAASMASCKQRKAEQAGYVRHVDNTHVVKPAATEIR